MGWWGMVRGTMTPSLRSMRMCRLRQWRMECISSGNGSTMRNCWLKHTIIIMSFDTLSDMQTKHVRNNCRVSWISTMSRHMSVDVRMS